MADEFEFAGNNAGGRPDVAAANCALPNAGGPGAELFGAGVLLIAVGPGIAVAARRRRSTGVHTL